jgi:RecB family exonuclease
MFVTRSELYERLCARLAHPRPLPLLSSFERLAIAQAAAFEAVRTAPPLPFQLRTGLVVEILRFYDHLKRQNQTTERFETLMEEALGGGAAEIDRGAERMLRQTRFLAGCFRAYERRLSQAGCWDEHSLRQHLRDGRFDTPVSHVVAGVSDWIAEPDGLFPADFDLLTRMPGLEAVDVLATEATLQSGFHQRLHDWLPGLEERAWEIRDARPAPALVVPSDAGQLWFSCRDREEELLAVARRAARRDAGDPTRTAVVYKHPLPYLYLAPATLGAAGVPYQSPDALPLATEPSAAAVDLVLDVVQSGFSREALAALLASPHFVFRGAAADSGAVLAHELAPLGEPAAASEQVRRLSRFLDAYRTPLDEAGPFFDRERRARAAIDDVLEKLATAHQKHHDPEWRIADLASAVRRAVQEQTFDSGEPASGVHLIDDQAARYGDFDHLSIVGVVEHEWPDRPKRNIFYPPGLLKALGWPVEKDRRAAADARFVDLLRSPCLTARVSAFTLEDEALVTPSLQLDEIPRAQLSTMPEPAVPSIPLLADEALTRGAGAAELLTAVQRDWLAQRARRPSGDLPMFHGSIGPSSAETVWSVSALETYLACPFKFFARYVLGLEEDADDDEILDPRRQGQLLHAVFERFFREWQAAGGRAITCDGLPEARRIFVQVVDEMLAPLPHAEAGLERTRLLGSPAASGLGEAVFRMEAERPDPVVERLLECKLDGEIRLQTPGGPRDIRLRGKADRIDLLDNGTFRLIDYKLGWPPDRTRALQLPIYALLAEQRLRGYRGRQWTLGEAAYLAFKGPRRVVPLVPAQAERTEVLDSALQRLSATLEAIARGEFPPRPDDVYRCETCGFAEVCRKDHVSA